MKKGWQTKKTSEIAWHSLGKMLDKVKNKGEPRPYLRNLNVRWFDFDLADVLEMRFLPNEEAKYTITKGDLVICEGGYSISLIFDCLSFHLPICNKVVQITLRDLREWLSFKRHGYPEL
jgi:hypothetical protein